ncbi:hypothetical protein [Acidipila sp. EB88]|uniref:hypothetical protein n=1 Tax=Acidipila sp. EB88 TaxID=2305226 RepID=UPI000F5E0DA1|nr:hypothetical protein [Acidipila sp. EB88]RRA48219.1 hypothetical protein D1Y84_07885 [Acidipila sp. EB88]
MQIFIDNQDGKGLQDYTPYLHFAEQAEIKKALNKPSVCVFSLVNGGEGVGLPARNSQVVVASAAGTTLFSGYIIENPALKAIGDLNASSCYVAQFSALSNDSLLDGVAVTTQNILVGASIQQQWNTLGGIGTSAAEISTTADKAVNSRVEVLQGQRWTEIAASVGATSRSVYRSTSAAGITVTSLGEVSHAVRSDDPGLVLKPVVNPSGPWLSEDITLCGREEPTAFVTEVFVADGVTATYQLSEAHFTPVAQQVTAISDLFQGTSLDPGVWVLSDPGAHLALTADGLTCLGGTGRSAEATVTAVQNLELGGAITLTAGGVAFQGGGSGLLVGLYAGAPLVANCIVGYEVNTAGAVSSLTPVVQGVNAGTTFTTEVGHLYTLRVRLCCAEVERARQSYFYLDGTGLGQLGGNTVLAGARVELEVQDVTAGTAGASILLYSGVVAQMAPSCTFAPLSSGSLVCSVKSVSCQQGSPLWVAVGSGEASAMSNYLATAVEGGSAQISTGGTLTFYPANVPATGQFIFVSYRLRERAVARQALTLDGQPATSSWIGTVEKPIAWSRSDCENAAAALLKTAVSSSAALQGTYTFSGYRATDLLPGDALSITGCGPTLGAFLTSVTVRLIPAHPEILQYEAEFSNDTVENFNIRVLEEVPEGVRLPMTATSIAEALPSLNTLSILSVSGSLLTVDTGVSAEQSGGFEVRRRDNTFGPGSDSDLVLRSSTSTIAIPRSAPVEQYYIRQYDGSVPPNYSLYSAAVFLNIPTS